MFAKWKERFVILTPNSIQVFKKATTRISEMGCFLYTLRLSKVEALSLEDRRGYLTIVMQSQSQEPGRLLLRKTEGIKDWFKQIQQIHLRIGKNNNPGSRMMSSQEFWNRRQFSEVGFSSIQAHKLPIAEQKTGM